MKELLNHLEYAKLFLIISVGMIALTFLIHIIFREKNILKFIPGIISLIIGIYGLITVDPRIIFLDDINSLTIFVIGTSVGLVGIFVAFIINVLDKNKVKKIDDDKKSEKTT
ncbi:MAG: hypothetical protein ACTHW2_06845 [Tissierella sp.]|uniref:hypothetical protein n=1 Tax=Tissierella sp. TaxID=41274 RepID=UPI003F9A7BA7